MKFELNGQVKNVDVTKMTVNDMLENQWAEIPKGIAIAVDEQIIPKGNWDTHFITDNQKVLIITATQGG